MKQITGQRRRKAVSVGSALLIGIGMAALPVGAWAALHADRHVQLNGGPHEIVHDAKSDQLYITTTGKHTQSDDGELLQLDPATLKVTRRIAMSSEGFGLALNNTTQRLYTANTRDRSISVVDAHTGKVVKTLKLQRDNTSVMQRSEPTQPREVVIDEQRNLVYVSGVSSDGVIWVLDGRDNTVDHLIEGVGDTPTGLALDADNQRLYATLLKSDAVVAINLDSNSVVRRYDLDGSGPVNVTLDHQRRRLLVANQHSGNLSVINLDSGETVTTVDTGDGAFGVTLDAEGNRIYVANRGAGTVTVLDADNYHRLATLKVGTHPGTIAVDEDSHVAWVTSRAAQSGKNEASNQNSGGSVTRIVP